MMQCHLHQIILSMRPPREGTVLLRPWLRDQLLAINLGLRKALLV